ncbi:hypothetical protein BJ912DRAFT_109414 [Pholiota molesta]|nr:hypothetical protein BJ912DRAFT_109414 [Pholiota molesta]
MKGVQSIRMSPPASFSLPRLLLLASIIISSGYLGLIIPTVRQLPLKLSIAFFTIFFHTSLALSQSPPPNITTRPHYFYINPLEAPFNAWSLVISLSWISFFFVDFHKLWLGARGDTDFCFAIWAGIESTINIRFLYLCTTAWRTERGSFSSRPT